MRNPFCLPVRNGTVTDFSFKIYMSCYVCPQWTQVGFTGVDASFEGTVDAYSKSKSKIKRYFKYNSNIGS